jgi:hypothetical protein
MAADGDPGNYSDWRGAAEHTATFRSFLSEVLYHSGIDSSACAQARPLAGCTCGSMGLLYFYVQFLPYAQKLNIKSK